jgi:hypothetical protein
MMVAGGAVSFGGSFVLGWLTQTTRATEGAGEAMSMDSIETDASATGLETAILPPPQASPIGTSGAGHEDTTKAMTEKRLKSLICEIQENIRQYKDKLQGLELLEQRLQIAQETLKEDVETLNNLRIEVAAMIARLQSERDKLLKSRVEIAQMEKANLMSIASAYDKMDVTSAGRILTNMCVMGKSATQKDDFGGGNSGMNDAVKILYYMGERTKAKLLAELVNSEPKLAAVLCQRLKQTVERE